MLRSEIRDEMGYPEDAKEYRDHANNPLGL